MADRARGGGSTAATPAPRDERPPPAVPEGATPGTREFVDVGEVDLHCVTAGPEEGPLVVLLHGFPEFWYSWRRQIPALADAGFRVVAPDMRGYNRSDRPAEVGAYGTDRLVDDVTGLIDRQDRESAHVVGHDWGGTVAWWVAIDRPEVVDRLAILNAPHPSAYHRELRSFDQFRRAWYVFYFQVPRLPEWGMTRNDCAMLESIFRDEAASEGAFTDADLERYRRAFGRPGAARAAINYYRAAFRRDVPQFLTGGIGDKPVEVPTQVIWGEQDTALSPRLLEGLDRWVSDLRVERLPGASHWVQHDAPERVSDRLRSFLE